MKSFERTLGRKKKKNESLWQTIGERDAEVAAKGKELENVQQELDVLTVKYKNMDLDAARICQAKDAKIAELKEALAKWDSASNRSTVGGAS